jgi:hypothetical protein
MRSAFFKEIFSQWRRLGMVDLFVINRLTELNRLTGLIIRQVYETCLIIEPVQETGLENQFEKMNRSTIRSGGEVNKAWSIL